MTQRAMFTDEEWLLLTHTPRWVVRAASAAQPDNAHRTHLETEAGFLAVADGRTRGSALVAEIAQATMDIFDNPRAVAGLTDDEAGLTATIERAAAAVTLLAGRAPGDFDTYRRWLMAISDAVVVAARSRIGGAFVTELEEAFDRRLERALAD